MTRAPWASQVVAHPHSDAATVLCATSHGTVVRLRLSASAADYSPPDIWLDAAATNGCAVTSLDSDAATQEVVFATRAGALATAALERGGFSATFLQPGGSCTSFAAVRFVGTGGGGHRAAAGGSHVIATVGSAPGCSLFDPLAPPSTGPVLRCPGSSPGQRFSCLAVEPGTSHGALLAAGCSDEPGACVWDTRQPSTPLWTWRQAGGGGAPGAHCTTVAFDPGACFSSTGGEYPMPPRTGAAAATTSTQRTSGLLLATSSGVLVGCTVSKEQQPQVGLARESAPVGHCAVVPGSGQQLAAVTDAECLLLWDARSAGALDAMM